MQLKGLVKFFTAALILISLYQLSFTFIVRNVEKKAQLQALRKAETSHPGAPKDTIEKYSDIYYQAITDSLQGEPVANMLIKKYTYQDAKGQELNLGLDLQGGMNVTLEVSLDELIRSLSNNPADKALNKAIADAQAAKASSQADFVTLFGQKFEQNNPGVQMNYLFTRPSEKEITLSSTNEQVLNRIQREAGSAIQNTYNVLRTRIDKFGVAQPNVNLDASKGIITVELAGVRNPERVREYLQATARLQFWEMYTDQNLIDGFRRADAALGAYLAGNTAADTAAAAPAAPATPDTALAAAQDAQSDTAGLAALVGPGSQSADTSLTGAAASANSPLIGLLSANPGQNGDPAAFGYVYKKDINKFQEYLKLDVVKNKLPGNAKFLIAAESRSKKFDPNTPLAVYVVRTLPGTQKAKLEGDHITDARMNYDPLSGKPVVEMEMDNTGSKIWAKMTGDNVGRFVAVSLDDRVYSAPRVNGQIDGGNTQISGGFSVDEATDLANILKSGKLEVSAQIVQEQVVGPTLGAENIRAGMMSLGLSFVIIFVLMMVYFNTSGIIANIALILNLLFTIGILSALQATLTMAGIAGLVLTVGMAVDTNVIVFERIKEELSIGKGYDQAVVDGYRRSYAPVLDGHITSLITAIILFIFGLGPVKGFATTQIIGLLLSMYCGLLVSRLITEMYAKRGRHFKYFTNVSKSIFRKANFNFVGKRKIAYGISVVVLLLAVASFFNGFDYGVEFSGGRSYTVNLEQKHDVSEVRTKLEKHFGEFPVVKTLGQDNTINITTAYLIEDPNQREAADKVTHRLHEGLLAEGLLPAGTDFNTFMSRYYKEQQTVLPTISDDLKTGAIWATGLSLLAIFLYILLRFRKWQYSLGTIVALLHDVCVTLAVFSFLRGRVPFSLEIDQHFIAAILTVIGFSMNDTVIVFDRIREYFRKEPGMDKATVVNRAINDTLSRTIMTSLTVLLTVVILFIFGGEVTRGFAFAMIIGVVIGSYSSIFVAAPILLDMDKSDRLKDEVDREARIEELRKLA